MTWEEYTSKLEQLASEFTKNKNLLTKEYVLSNNTYNVGDKFTDHIGTIIIEKIKYSLGDFYSKPCAVYYGIELDKNGKKNKRGNKRHAYQSNEKL